ncbi:Suppressor of Stomatin mutant Uncoordination [Caenorhabditis elegans]|uniref:Suppressor of Stomatin mutant Uncoordination n=1 Tax=Caenorhabditis elegans TaxID=6239 RepID=H1UBK3_CAEEL|nr:Suppressor of Stomatin mutant Uncoordination [Caenorhabditis elegans]CCF23330.1 Suppressor of Stomatin mutant Uncoordination [Caenorhabditis elegans]|eukprot:NP_001255806.1 Suppressor of Stomatin mutant Uncoordination [Caenorhabditis elegans]
MFSLYSDIEFVPIAGYKPPNYEASASSKMQYFDDIIPFGEFECREALEKEVKRHRYWKSKTVKKMNFDRIEPSTSIHYILESFTEARSTSEATEAANFAAMSEASCSLTGGSGALSPWDFEVMPGHLFVDQVRVFEMPGSSQINPCSACNSDGTIHCFHCRGYGTDKCSFCRGTGMKSGVAHPAVYTHPMIATFPHADLSRGYASSSTAMVRHGGSGSGSNSYGIGTPMHFMSKTGVPPPGIGTHDLCYMCHGRGIKECHHCKGGGKKPCTSCSGTGSVRNYTRIKVYFKNEKSEHYTESEIPEKLLFQAEGKRIFEEEQDYIIPISQYQEEDVNKMSKLFCAQHLQKCMGVCRVIRQRHYMNAIPISKVHFSLGGEKGIFYVYGTQKLCYFPNFPSKCVIL